MLDTLCTLIEALPDNQEFKAGIHGVVKRASITRLYKNAILTPDNIITPATEESITYVRKSKVCNFDAYIAITQQWLLIAPCNNEDWLYERVVITDPEQITEYAPFAQPLSAPLPAREILPIEPLENITGCTIKKNWIGAYNCTVDLLNGDQLKIMLPRLGGLGGGMPNHARYRDAIVDTPCNTSRI